MESIPIISGYPYLAKTGSNGINMWCCLLLIGILVLLLPRVTEAFSIKSEPAEVGENPKLIPDAQRNAVCHPQCCLQAQWPVEHMKDEKIDMTGYVKTEYSCKGCKNGSGCLCMRQEDYAALKGSA